MLTFRFAEVKDQGEKWYVEFHVLHPLTRTMTRKRIYINRYKSLALRKKHLIYLAEEINKKLLIGWNPFIEEAPSKKMYQTMYDALDYVLNQSLRVIEESSKANYIGRIRFLKEWLKKIGKENMLCCEFTPDLAAQYMEHCYDTRDISGRTYNNYLIDYKSFFNSCTTAIFVNELIGICC